MVYHFDWNEDNVAKLKRCIDAKMSARATSVLLGCTRSAAVSAAIRHGTRFQSNDLRNNYRAVPVEEMAPPAPTPFSVLPSLSDIKLAVAAQSLRDSVRAELAWTREDPEPTAITCEGVTIHELRPIHCRAVIAGDCWEAHTIRYCGKPRANERFSFCKDHAELYLTTPAKMRAAAAREAE